MSTEATVYQQQESPIDFTAVAAITGGQVVNINGKAGVVPSAVAASGAATAQTEGVYTVTKNAGEAWLPGSEIWWDAANSEASIVPQYSGIGFRLGVSYTDAASADTEGKVILNGEQATVFDLHKDGGTSVVVKTSGTPDGKMTAGAFAANFSATAEAQKVDLLSLRSFPITGNWIMEADFVVNTDFDAAAADLNIGVANGTHASDADSITESVFVHVDGGSANLTVESDDGTTENAAADSTVDYAVGTPQRIVMDGRDHTDIKVYIDGVRVMDGTTGAEKTLTLADGTGPLKFLFHMEKSSDDTPGIVQLLNARVWMINE